MHRRTLVIGGLAALASPCIIAAQSRTVPRVGVMLGIPLPNPYFDAFRAGLREHGYIEGKNIHLEYRSAEGVAAKYPGLAAEMVRLRVDVIVAGGGTPSARAAKEATRAIPIVFPAAGDPVAEGLVQSLARPGGNVTGLSILNRDINAKRLQLLKDLLPRAQRLAVLRDSSMRADQGIEIMEDAGRELGLRLQLVSAGRPEQYASAFAAARDAGAEGLIVLPSSSFQVNRRQLIDLAAQHRLMTLWEHKVYVLSGGLISYGPDIADMYRNAARYVDKILKGAKPADIPVEQSSKLELTINLSTANAQNISIPQAMLVRADQIIE